jgi:magnesium chelatase accessory protein
MRDRLQWDIDGRDWPNRAWSRFVTAAGLRWHVQVSAERDETVLLVHGTGASSHSWRGLAPLLAANYRIVSVDLPGHGFTGALPPGAASLPCIAEKLTALLQSLSITPQWAVGHSAGAAIIARIAVDGVLPLRAIASLNGALLPLPGWSRRSQNSWQQIRWRRGSSRGVPTIRPLCGDSWPARAPRSITQVSISTGG